MKTPPRSLRARVTGSTLVGRQPHLGSLLLGDACRYIEALRSPSGLLRGGCGDAQCDKSYASISAFSRTVPTRSTRCAAEKMRWLLMGAPSTANRREPDRANLHAFPDRSLLGPCWVPCSDAEKNRVSRPSIWRPASFSRHACGRIIPQRREIP